MTDQTSGATETASIDSSAASTESSAPKAATPAPQVQGQEGSLVAANESQAPAWQPNYKFKVFDKEHEFDEWVRPMVNKDTEEKLRDLYTKAYGLEHIKPKYETTRSELEKIKPEHTRVMQGLGDLNTFLEKGDLGSFFNRLQISEDKVMKFVLDKLNEENLPPDQKQQLQRQRQMESEADTLRKQNEQMQTAYQQEIANTRAMMLDMGLGRQEVKQVAESFDARLGKPGAFREEVIKRGILHHQLTGQDITPEQAIQETMLILGLGGTSSQMAPTQPQVVPQKQVIPNVSGRGSAPTKKSVNSLEELRKLHDNF